MNSSINPGEGDDLLVGLSTEAKTLTVNRGANPVKISDRDLSWITPTGGAYFFTPSRSGLRKLIDTSSSRISFKAKKLVAVSADWINETVFRN